VNYESDKIASNNYLRSILKKIKKIQTNSLTLLDIGSANGYFVKLSEEFGIKAKGIEISLDAVNWGLKLGRNVINSDFESFNDGIFYDVVTVLDVLEHIQNPKDFIRKVYKSHLKIGGLLVCKINWKKMACSTPARTLVFL
jgi:2-polyprenyl-3-methyl-5-hydroxy-6-metoxy-1,4-benzoquinol methylase